MQKLSNLSGYKIILVLALIALAIWTRFVPHPANFTALTAVALFSGALLPKRLSFTVVLAAMIVSDLFIGLHSLSFVVWGSFAAMTLMGSYALRQKQTPWRVVLASFAGSTMFYLVTNFAVWAEGRMYVMNLAGLMQSYINALPFYRNMMVGDLIYASLLFGAYVSVRSGVRMLHSRKQVLSAN